MFLNQIRVSRARFPLHVIRKIFNIPFPSIFHNFKFAVAVVCPSPRRVRLNVSLSVENGR